MKNRKKPWAAALVLLVGVGILSYPAVSNDINRLHGSRVIQQLDALDADQSQIRHQMELARAYNEALKTGGAIPADYDDILDFGDGIMGYIRIPAIDVQLPIYHGVDQDQLARGVGHLPGTALPIGGEGNHPVLSAHTGYPEARLFTDLSDVEPGDRFYIRILGEDLCYRVDQIQVVLPQDAQALEAEPGKDLCTLVTCTPYGINSHRLLVRGIREENAIEEPVTEGLWEDPMGIWLWIPVAALPAALAVVAVKHRRRKEDA